MTLRTASRAVILFLAGAVTLGVAIHSRAVWHQSSDRQMVLTLGQLMGFLFGTVLLVVAITVAVVGMRSGRADQGRSRSADQG